MGWGDTGLRGISVGTCGWEPGGNCELLRRIKLPQYTMPGPYFLDEPRAPVLLTAAIGNGVDFDHSCLYIGGLARHTNPEELAQMFSRWGKVRGALFFRKAGPVRKIFICACVLRGKKRRNKGLGLWQDASVRRRGLP